MDEFSNDVVSVIMPVYNSENYIVESIESVIKQTYSFWELIIINDYSSDNSIKIIQYYQSLDKRIKLINLEKNLGVAGARNIGIQNALGRYIAFLDSDDVWLPEKLEHQIKFMQEMQAPMSYTQYRHFTNEISESDQIIDVEFQISYKQLLKGNIIGCLTTIIDRKFVSEIYMPDQRHEDYIAWLNILKKGVYAYGLKEDLARYRKNLNSLSGNKFKSLNWTWNVYRKSEKLSFMKSSYYFCHYILKGLRKHSKF